MTTVERVTPPTAGQLIAAAEFSVHLIGELKLTTIGAKAAAGSSTRSTVVAPSVIVTLTAAPGAALQETL
jgi:hypothetical protein